MYSPMFSPRNNSTYTVGPSDNWSAEGLVLVTVGPNLAVDELFVQPKQTFVPQKIGSTAQYDSCFHPSMVNPNCDSWSKHLQSTFDWPTLL
jgi:hypothetical protein